MSSPASTKSPVSSDRSRTGQRPSDRLPLGIGVASRPLDAAWAGAADRRRAGPGVGSLARPPTAQGDRQPAHRFRLMERRRGPRRGPGGRTPADPRPADAVEAVAASYHALRRRLCRRPAGGARRLGQDAGSRLSGGSASVGRSVGQAAMPLAAPRRSNTLAGSRANIHHHYDIGDDFYRLWLDEQMLYTCGYFPSAAATLEEAQRAKMDHICRKLWLRPGETVVEAGCGWGRWPCTWPPATASPSRLITSRASRSAMPGGGHAPRASTAASSSSTTITAIFAGPATSSSRSACWSTSGPNTTASSSPPSTARSVPPAAA